MRRFGLSQEGRDRHRDLVLDDTDHCVPEGLRELGLEVLVFFQLEHQLVILQNLDLEQRVGQGLSFQVAQDFALHELDGAFHKRVVNGLFLSGAEATVNRHN